MFESKINRGRANGYAPLDGSGKVPLDKLPPIQSTIDTGSLVTMGQTGSFATTGSNTFIGIQTLAGTSGTAWAELNTGQTAFFGYDSYDLRATGSSGAGVSVTSDVQSIFGVFDANEIGPDGNVAIIGTSKFNYPLSDGPGVTIQIQKSGSFFKAWLYDYNGTSYVPSDINIGYTDGVFPATSGSLNIRDGNINVSGSVNISSSLVVSSTVVNNGTINALNSDLIIENGNIILSGSLSASLAEGYMWVGGYGDVTNVITTSSFGGTSGTSGVNGDNGSQGPAGSSFTWAGDWNSESIYGDLNTVVQYQGSSYVCINASGNLNKIPSVETGYWNLMALAGTSGVNGTSGIDGIVGTSGTSGFSIDSGSYATTGSNQFNGSQQITGSLSVSTNLTVSSTLVNIGAMALTNGSNLTIGTGSFLIVSSSQFVSGSILVNGQQQITGSLLVTGSITLTSGSVIMPHRPAFRLVGDGGAIISPYRISGSRVTMDYNQGNHFNPANGEFTAPIAGLYQVNIVGRTNSNSLAGISQIIVEKRKASDSSTSTQIMVEWAANTTVNHIGGSTISQLAVGDKLYAWVGQGTISFDGNDNFSVAYIG